MKSDKTKITNLIKATYVGLNPNKNLVKWSSSRETKNNFGDALNPWLFEKITGKKPENANHLINLTRKPVYSCIGSILDDNNLRNLKVWGSGFKSEKGTMRQNPNEVFAVRGPLTRNKLIEFGVDCPEVYGDPALLLPKYYNPTIMKKYEVGVIAHYVDKEKENFTNFSNSLPEGVLIIDIESNIEDVVNNILKCKKIISSSLHGIIVADAYSIPSLHVKFSDEVVGGDFKFRDYMLSVQREYVAPIVINSEVSLDFLLNSFEDYEINIDLEKLIEACPFRKQSIS